MTGRLLRVTTVALACISLALPACETASVGTVSVTKPGTGPPPHAPAHGYRAQHRDGVVLVYNSGQGVYKVSGLPDIYFKDGFFFQLSGDQWRISAHVKGPWETATEGSVPPGLRGKEKKGSGRGRGNDRPNRGKGKGAQKKK